MFRDFNNEEESKKVTLNNSKAKILKIQDKVEKISNDKTKIASIVIMADTEAAFCAINGSFGYLRKAMVESCKENEDFANLIKAVAAQVVEEEMGPDEMEKLGKLIKNTLQDKINDEVKKNGSSKFKDEDGVEGFAIDMDKIGDMTDKEIDDIVENMLKSKGLEFPKKDDESE
tara:strand:+ start:705 stop:1223 length:519 start_codon:yes stop_codon:yes gene_type:complete